MSDDKRLTFSREIRLGEVLTVLFVSVAVVASWQRNDSRIGRLEDDRVEQKAVNAELKTTIKETANELRSDIREVANTVRRIENRESRVRGG